jgi:hypothetical protein
MTQEDLEREAELGIRIVREEMTVTYEQVIHLQHKTKISDALGYLQNRLRAAGMTGEIRSELQNGGCRAVVVRHTRKVPAGSPLQESIEFMLGEKKLT